MFGSSLPQIVCRRAYLPYLCLLAHSSIQHILFLLCFSLSSVPYGVRFSGLSIFEPLRYSLTFIQQIGADFVKSPKDDITFYQYHTSK